MINDETGRVLDEETTPPAASETDEATGAPRGDETPEERVARLERELEAARDEAAQFRNKYLRAEADMQNYRKSVDRVAVERDRAFRRSLLARFLPVIDNLDRALAQTERGGSIEAIAEGVRLTRKGMLDVLAAEGVQAIEAQGQPFDPHVHEAVGTAPATPETPAGTVVAEAEKGYTFEGLVLRPARVIVAE